MAAVAQLLLGVVAVLASAWLFTNALEWFGQRMGLGHGALGSVFAAVGTALPEASIAILAAIWPGPNVGGAAVGDAVSIGAVLGAPLLLATLGFAVLGIGSFLGTIPGLQADPHSVRRDLVFFLAAFGTAGVLGALGAPLFVRIPAGLALIGAYVVFVVRTLAADADHGESPVPAPLLLSRHPRAGVPGWGWIAVQLLVALGVMFGGAELFVHTLTGVSVAIGLSGFVLAALIAPLATELPETVNSILWIGQDKDALATGNVTGALVLQGAVIPAIGMWIVPWHFDAAEIVGAAVAWVGAAVVLAVHLRLRRLPAALLLGMGLPFAGFAVWVLAQPR